MNKVKTNFQQKQFDGAPVMKWKKKSTGLNSPRARESLRGFHTNWAEPDTGRADEYRNNITIEHFVK